MLAIHALYFLEAAISKPPHHFSNRGLELMNASEMSEVAPKRSSQIMRVSLRWLPLLLILFGIVIRLEWATTAPTESLLVGEANNVAVSFANTGTISDAFRVGQGPTAHVMPLAPMVAGLIYRLFGVHSGPTGMLLSLWSLGLVAVAWICLYRGFALIGMPRAARLGALAFLTLAPINVSLEAVQFRVWEGALGVALAYTFLYRVLWLDRREAVKLRQLALLGFHAALTLLVSPPLGVAAFFCGLLLMVRRTEVRRWPGIVAVVFAVTVATMAPWTARNIAVMHAPIVLRDNFGLELAAAYYPGADAPGDDRAKFKARHNAIHPYQPPGNAAMVAAGGEVAYAALLGKEATSYISAHPRAFLVLSLRHLRDFLFTPAWEWSQFGRSGKATTVKLVLNWLITGIGLSGIIYGLIRYRTIFVYVSAMALLPILPYIFVQPTLRYHYIIVNLLVFIAAGLIAACVAWLSNRRGAKSVSASADRSISRI